MRDTRRYWRALTRPARARDADGIATAIVMLQDDGPALSASEAAEVEHRLASVTSEPKRQRELDLRLA